jgi:hypothetical protein
VAGSWFTTALLFALAATAPADTLTLRDGTSVTGTFVDIDAEKVRILVNNGLRSYPRSDVFKVKFDTGPALAPQSQPSQPGGGEPELIGPVYLQDEAGKLIPLERTTWTMREGRKGKQGGPKSWEINGDKSPVRFKSGRRIMFVVRLANGIDPSTHIIFALETKKGSRWIESDPQHKIVPATARVNVTKVGESTYGLTPARDLAAGEYVIYNQRGSGDRYCFGVDPE